MHRLPARRGRATGRGRRRCRSRTAAGRRRRARRRGRATGRSGTADPGRRGRGRPGRARRARAGRSRGTRGRGRGRRRRRAGCARASARRPPGRRGRRIGRPRERAGHRPACTCRHALPPGNRPRPAGGPTGPGSASPRRRGRGPDRCDAAAVLTQHPIPPRSGARPGSRGWGNGCFLRPGQRRRSHRSPSASSGRTAGRWGRPARPLSDDTERRRAPPEWPAHHPPGRSPPLGPAVTGGRTTRSGGAHAGAPGWNCRDCKNRARSRQDLR